LSLGGRKTRLLHHLAFGSHTSVSRRYGVAVIAGMEKCGRIGSRVQIVR
jgi:hypothetical protein